MTRVEKTVFISYRRTNVPWALTIAQNLTHSGFDVFLDYTGIGSGDFEPVILENIRARAHFLVILTPLALEHCDTPGDWLRREIEEALETRRNIVPLMMEGFAFGAAGIASKLTGKLAALKNYNGMTVPAEYFDAAMTKLRDTFLNIPLDAVLHPASEFAQQVARKQQAAAASASPSQQKELTAQEWFEQGVNTSNQEEAIRCYTAALQLKPDDAMAYSARGRLRYLNGNADDARQDFTEVIRLKPDDAMAYYARGVLREGKDDWDGALQNYTAALRLKPDDALAYFSRGFVRYLKDDIDGAIQDYTKGIRYKPDWDIAYYGRGTLRDAKGDWGGAVEDFTEALRLKPDDAMTYSARAEARAHKGDLAGAVQDFTEALRLKPDAAEVYNKRGNVLLSKGDQKAAQRDFDKAKLLES